MRFGKLKAVLAVAALAGAVAVQAGESGRRECPGFGVQTQEQLDTWRAKLDAKNASAPAATAQAPRILFYTDKPYDADQNTYLFKYRAYDPNAARWTTSDPSGFPDGANNHVYSRAPMTMIDSTGLALVYVPFAGPGTFYLGVEADMTYWNYGYSYAAIHGYSLMVQALLHCESGTDWTLSEEEISIIKNNANYTTRYYNVVKQMVPQVAESAGPLVIENLNVSWTYHSDPYWGFGSVRITTDGELIGNLYENPSWLYTATASFDDTWDILTAWQNGGVNFWTPTAAAARLASHGWLHSGWHARASWSENWIE